MGQPTPPDIGANDPREGKVESTVFFMTQPQPPTPFPQYPIGDPGQPYSVWEGTTQGHKCQRWGQCRTSWRLATTVGEYKDMKTIFMMLTIY